MATARPARLTDGALKLLVPEVIVGCEVSVSPDVADDGGENPVGIAGLSQDVYAPSSFPASYDAGGEVQP